MKLALNKVVQGDCLDVMQSIPNKSIQKNNQR